MEGHHTDASFQDPGDPLLISVMHYREFFHPVMPFIQAVTRCVPLDLSGRRADFTPEVYQDLDSFCTYIDGLLTVAGAEYGIGGYAEDREMYARSQVFDAGEEPRRLHLGLDIWALADTPVYAPLAGIIHSIGLNNAVGDYGGTLILSHELGGQTFHTLYGHLASSVDQWSPGDPVPAGAQIARLGAPLENGHWPPHLHFQVIRDMEGMKGDYPGVCRRSERVRYLRNCPDPMPLLGFNPFSL